MSEEAPHWHPHSQKSSCGCDKRQQPSQPSSHCVQRFQHNSKPLERGALGTGGPASSAALRRSAASPTATCELSATRGSNNSAWLALLSSRLFERWAPGSGGSALACPLRNLAASLFGPLAPNLNPLRMLFGCRGCAPTGATGGTTTWPPSTAAPALPTRGALVSGANPASTRPERAGITRASAPSALESLDPHQLLAPASTRCA